MGLIKGSCSITKFKVKEGEKPDESLAEYLESIARLGFTDIVENSDIASSHGWVNLMNNFSTDFSDNEFFKPPYVCLSLRRDTRSVPNKTLAQQCYDAEELIKKENDLEFLAKKHKKEIRDTIFNKLIRQAIPVSSYHDMVWDTDKGTVLFTGTSPKISDMFSFLFKETFDLSLLPVYPYSMACDLYGEDAAANIWPIDSLGGDL